MVRSGLTPLVKVNDHLHLVGGVVLHPLDLDLALVVGLEDALDEGGRGHAVRHLLHDEGLVVLLAQLGPDPDTSAPEAVVVLLTVGLSSGREVRQKLEAAALEVGHRPVDELVEVVRQHLARQADGDALRPLLEQQRELDGQGLRLLVPAVIAGQPVGRLRIEKRLLGEGAQAGLDVTRRCGAVPGEDVAPVSLTIQRELPLADLHHGVPDARIPVGVVLHRVADGIGHLVETAIVHLLQAVQDATLDRLQSVVQVRNRPLENDVRRIIEEVLVVHPLDADDLLHVGTGSVIAFPVRLVRSGFPSGSCGRSWSSCSSWSWFSSIMRLRCFPFRPSPHRDPSRRGGCQ